MKIQHVEFVPGTAAFFFDDQKAIAGHPPKDGFLYAGNPETPGFDSIREPAEALSILLYLDNGHVAVGDCCAVQYAAVAGRDPLFRAAEQARLLDAHLGPWLTGRSFTSFRQACDEMDALRIDGRPLHAAVSYGLSQAFLDGMAKTQGGTIAECVLREYDLPKPVTVPRLYAQSGDARQINVDKMILKGVDVMPHGLINDPKEKVGANGEILLEFVRWVRNRILQLRQDERYCPELQFDTYGTLGMVFGMDLDRITGYCQQLEAAAAPFPLRLEHPLDGGSREVHLELFTALRAKLKACGCAVELAVDEWCNTLEDIRLFARKGAVDMVQIKTPDLGGLHRSIEAVTICKQAGVKAFIGGSCAETDVSARITAQVALATQPYQVLAKPGMGVDEGIMILRNEMNRGLRMLTAPARLTSNPAKEASHG